MGLSIHYSGTFNKNTSLKEMIEEVKDVAKAFNWEYEVFEEEFPENSLDAENFHPENLYGIYITPPHCEPVFICFLSNGKMSGPVQLKFFGNPENDLEKLSLHTVSVKTQYAGIEVHKLIIHLFKHLSKKYLINFEMEDEGGYWETLDEKVLDKKFSIYNNLMDKMSLALETLPKNSEESFDQYLKRLMNIIHKNENKKGGNLN